MFVQVYRPTHCAGLWTGGVERLLTGRALDGRPLSANMEDQFDALALAYISPEARLLLFAAALSSFTGFFPLALPHSIKGVP